MSIELNDLNFTLERIADALESQNKLNEEHMAIRKAEFAAMEARDKATQAWFQWNYNMVFQRAQSERKNAEMKRRIDKAALELLLAVDQTEKQESGR